MNCRTRNRRETVPESVIDEDDGMCPRQVVVYIVCAQFMAVDEVVSTIADRKQCQCLDERRVVRSETCRGAIDGFSMYEV